VKLSVIVPALDEAAGIASTLQALAPLRAAGHEVIVVDGGSTDATAEIAARSADRVLSAPRGRARQMNAGAAIAAGDALLFLHADTRLPEQAAELMQQALARSSWGRFDVRIEGDSPGLAIVAFFMNWRSRLTGIATGDQAIFVRREAFAAAGQYPEIPLMEDVELSARLKRISAPARIAARAATSGRRWERRGVLRTVLLMWRLRLAYSLGARPEDLARRYANGT
jgi:rSAM/selenodomain-associated transferase 2